MKFLKLFVAMLAIFSLSACLGDNDKSVTKAEVVDPEIGTPVDEEEEEEDETPVAVTFEQKANFFNRMVVDVGAGEGINDSDDIDNLENTVRLPHTGTAEYVGVMVLPDPSFDEDAPSSGVINGELEMALNFSNFVVTGEAGNFSNSLDEVWSGSLEVSGDYKDEIAVDGTITADDGLGLNTVVVAYSEAPSFCGPCSGGNGDFELLTQDDERTLVPEYIVGHLHGDMTTAGIETSLWSGNNDFYAILD